MNKQAIIDAAVECFDLGPEDQEAVLRFGMRLDGMSGWISVDDRLPDDRSMVLAFVLYPSGDYVESVSFYHAGFWSAIQAQYVTHWMPIPTPPRP